MEPDMGRSTKINRRTPTGEDSLECPYRKKTF
jgi:hypothetical protein